MTAKHGDAVIAVVGFENLYLNQAQVVLDEPGQQDVIINDQHLFFFLFSFLYQGISLPCR